MSIHELLELYFNNKIDAHNLIDELERIEK